MKGFVSCRVVISFLVILLMNQCQALVCGENEVEVEFFEPCKENRCSDIGIGRTPCYRDPKDHTKTPGCACKKYFWRNAKGKCVPVDECPPLKCSAEKNLVYNSCPGCILLYNCEGLYKDCPQYFEKPECNPQCVCKKGLLMNDQGECVRLKQCKEYCPVPNSVYNPCGKECEITCANKDKVLPPRCSYWFEACIGPGSCVCRNNYARDVTGRCILKSHCPVAVQSGK